MQKRRNKILTENEGMYVTGEGMREKVPENEGIQDTKE